MRSTISRVKGIGEKTAKELLAAFSSIDELLSIRSGSAGKN